MGRKQDSRSGTERTARVAAILSITAVLALVAGIAAAPAGAHHRAQHGGGTSPSPTPTASPSTAPSPAPSPSPWPDPVKVLNAVAADVDWWIAQAEGIVDSAVVYGSQLLADGTAIEYGCWAEWSGYHLPTHHCRASYQGITVQCGQKTGLMPVYCYLPQ